MSKLNTGAVIVAAGSASQVCSFKPMHKIGSISMVQRIIANFQQANVFPIVLVTGFRGKELEKYISGTGIVFVRNDNYENTEMFDSAKIGFSFIKDKCSRTFFTPVDIPLFTARTTSMLLESDAPVAIPVCNGKPGHPILLSCNILQELTEVKGEGGLKNAIQECCPDIQAVEVEDEGILQDADTAQDFRQLIEKHNKQLLRPSIEISLMRENKLFDKDGAMLLNMINYTGTVKDACKKMRISYSKAWSILSMLEENLGIALINRQPGGEYGGGSKLTPEGLKLLKNYTTFKEKVKEYANQCFEECFNGKLK